MRQSVCRLIPRAACGLILLLAAGCTIFTPLPDGSQSAMGAAHTQLRSQLRVNPLVLPRRPTYVPERECTYKQVKVEPNGKVTEVFQSVSTKAVRDRLLITIVEPSGTSTVLMGMAGTLYDFNLADNRFWAGSNANTYQAYAAQMAARARQTDGPTAHVINPISLLFPEYIDGSRLPGTVMAKVTTEVGSLWGEYIYKGLTQYRGTNAAVLDLARTVESMPRRGPVIVGFTIVDASTMMPLLAVLDAGYKYTLETMVLTLAIW